MDTSILKDKLFYAKVQVALLRNKVNSNSVYFNTLLNEWGSFSQLVTDELTNAEKLSAALKAAEAEYLSLKGEVLKAEQEEALANSSDATEEWEF